MSIITFISYLINMVLAGYWAVKGDITMMLYTFLMMFFLVAIDWRYKK